MQNKFVIALTVMATVQQALLAPTVGTSLVKTLREKMVVSTPSSRSTVLAPFCR